MGVRNALIILLVAALATLGTLLYSQSGLVKEQQREIVDLSSKIKLNEKQTNFDMQAKCADQAQKEFISDGWNKKPLASFTNHFNEKLGKCFMLIDDELDGGLTAKYVTDAYEGKDYAQYEWIMQKGKKYWEVPPITCEVIMPSGEHKLCKSSDEFDDLTKIYME